MLVVSTLSAANAYAVSSVISVLPILSKIAERHVHNALYSFLSENDLIYTRQSGFRPRHSTETTLAKVIDDILFNLDNDCVNGMVLFDYRKAFNMIDHTLLLKKLEVYGLSTEWFTSHLRNRGQLVKLGINSQMLPTFLMVFPRDLYSALCYLSSSVMAYPFMSLHLRLICMLMIQR